jgi:hypothetical protein
LDCRISFSGPLITPFHRKPGEPGMMKTVVVCG